MTYEVREPTFLVLTALAGGPLHGYGMIQQVEELSEGRLRLRAGTLYATLDRLSDEGFVAVEREEVVNGRLRRYYRISGEGAALLSVESHRRLTVSSEAIRRLQVAGLAL